MLENMHKRDQTDIKSTSFCDILLLKCLDSGEKNTPDVVRDADL